MSPARIKYLFLTLLFAFVFWQSGQSQNITGIPIIKNFSKSDYRASTQNWSICQGTEGYMYFGNNQGVLQYTGYDWQLVEMANYSIVRSVLSVGKDSILVGAFNELGLLQHDNTGQAKFISWNHKIPDHYKNYGEIWRIHILGHYTFFQAFKSLLIFKKGDFFKAIIPENEFRFSYVIDNELYIQERSKGLFKLSGDSLVLTTISDFFRDKEIWSLFRLDETKILAGTQYHGFFILEKGKISVWDTPANQFALKYTLFNGIQLSNKQFAFGSVLNGTILTDAEGKIKLNLNKQNGIQNNTILSIYEDKHHNIWLGLDNGIDYIKTNLPLSFIRKNGGFGTGYCSIMHNNKLYAGTNQGLFKLDTDTKQNLLSNQGEFMLVPKTEGQVWGLYKLNGKLLCGHNSGLFVLNENETSRIFDTCGVWDVKTIPNRPNSFLVGTYYGFYLLTENNGAFTIVEKIKGFEESARRFFFDLNGFLWVSHGYKGIYQLKFAFENSSVQIVKLFNSSNDLPTNYNNEAVFLRGKVLATTEKGIYEFNFDENKFTYNSKWDDFFNGDARQFTHMIEGNAKKIWAFKKGSVQLLTYLNDKIYELNTRPFLHINGTLSRSYENVQAIGQNQYIIGTEDGFVLYKDIDSIMEAEKIPMTVVCVESIGNNNIPDSTETIPVINTLSSELGNIPFRKRHLRIHLAMPCFSNQELVKFRFNINNGGWGKWLSGNKLDLNGLSDNNYKIDFQCSVDEKEIAGKTRLNFTILPPMSRTWYAFLIYLFFTLGLAFIAYRIVKKRIAHEKRKEFLAQKKKMIRQGIKLKRKAQEAENELNVLKNEKLQADIVYKSKELANTTMSIIQKNMILGEIKETLQELIKENSVLKENSKINHLVRKINKGIEQEDKWMVFEQNFDQVHENFLKHLKENHPELTAKDMRLAAYLRMNLSSKEIAPLMNISVRSVEISRYRLRKKITIGHDQNLNDYLISL